MADPFEALDRYSRPTPYEVLSLPPDAGAADCRDRHAGLQRDLQDKPLSTAERAKEKERLDAAYNQLRSAGNRVRVDFFLLDPQLGLKQCEAIAATFARPNTDVQGILKPRQIRVEQAALFDELTTFFQEPGRVAGLHPQLMEVPEPVVLPEPLAIAFDC